MDVLGNISSRVVVGLDSRAILAVEDFAVLKQDVGDIVVGLLNMLDDARSGIKKYQLCLPHCRLTDHDHRHSTFSKL